jgi:inward rectifier potassium channel
MATRRIFKQDAYREIGFGSAFAGTRRLMNKDGSSNVERISRRRLSVSRIYHGLIRMKWGRFIVTIIGSYLMVNLTFAAIYFMIDSDHIGGMIFKSSYEKFMEIFFFSAQSLTTVGYGRLNPTGMLDSTIATIESLVGLLSFAIATGLLYARFSRPVANLAFSHNAVIAPYQGSTGLMVRLANLSKSEIMDPEATIVLTYIDEQSKVRKFSNLKLELTKVTMLTMSWTLVHPIDEESPIYSWTEEEIAKRKVEILVIIRGFDETFSQTVQTRTSYAGDEIIVGAKFISIIKPKEDGSVIVELDKISEYTPVALYESLSMQG